MKKIRIYEVGLRDGIQNEKITFSVQDRFHMLKRMIDAGLTHIEVGAFVSPKYIPQMKQTKAFVQKISKELKIPKSVELSVLVPNEYGFLQAVDYGFSHVAVMASATESFSKANTNCSIKENLKRIRSICRQARRHRIKIRAYLSMAFYCPYEGPVSSLKSAKIAEQMIQEGVEEVALSDTIGAATPRQVEKLLQRSFLKISPSQLGLHCHNTRGLALPNIFMGMQMGLRRFDSSIGGLGGCPYARGSTGNVATEDLIGLLKGLGFKIPVDISKLVQLCSWLEKRKKVHLTSHLKRLSKEFVLY